MFGGKGIKLTVWEFFDPRVKYWKSAFPQFTEVQSNVTLDLVQVPQADYWKKLLTAIPAGQGPDIFQFHNAQFTAFISGQLLEPYPESVFPKAYMESNFVGFKERHFHGPDGKWYFLPYGTMASGIYYNTKLWKEAGLTATDIPMTWDQLITAAKKLTKYDAAGKIIQAGFAFNSYEMVLWSDLLYQQGSYHFKPDGKSAYVDTEEGKKGMQFILDLERVHKVNDPNFPVYLEAFGTGKAGMAYSWGFFGGYLRTNYPDIQWDFFPLPTFSGKPEPAMGRNNYEVSLVVPAQAAADRKAAAFNFLSWLYGDGERLVDIALLHDILPGRTDLWTHPRIQDSKVVGKQTGQMPYTIFPGEFPSPWLATVNKYVRDAVFAAGSPLDAALKQAQVEGDKVLAGASYMLLERNYKNANLMKKD